MRTFILGTQEVRWTLVECGFIVLQISPQTQSDKLYENMIFGYKT